MKALVFNSCVKGNKRCLETNTGMSFIEGIYCVTSSFVTRGLEGSKLKKIDRAAKLITAEYTLLLIKRVL